MRNYWENREAIQNGTLAVITDIQRFTVHDGPGIRTMVFFKGCPLRCQWCQNPETWNQHPELMYHRDNCIGCGNCIKACPANALTSHEGGIAIDSRKCMRCGQCAEACFPGALKVCGTLMSVSDVLEKVMLDEVFYRKSGGGLTLSGGECTTYPQFVETLLREAQGRGVHTAIETCGFCEWDSFEKILAHVDLVLFDMKIPKNEFSKKYTGQECTLILDNLRKTRALGKRVILRYPLIPEINDDEQTLRIIASIALENHISEIHILPFHQMGSAKWHALLRPYPCKDKLSPSDSDIERTQNFLRSQGLNATIGGTDA